MRRSQQGLWLCALLFTASLAACGWLWPRDEEAEERLRGGSSVYRDAGLRPGDAALESSTDNGPRCPTDAVGVRCEEAGQRCWVAIPKGTFAMGSPIDELCRASNEDQHLVTLTHVFELQRTEVTQAEFDVVVGARPSYFTACGTDCPVDMVYWHDAAAYCSLLDPMDVEHCYSCESRAGEGFFCEEAERYRGSAIYHCPGYRLPTEAEWEYAYRAGSITAYYNSSNTSCEMDANADGIAWYVNNSSISNVPTTHPVGKKTPNNWGLHDMAGNVREWCHDRYQEYLGSAPATDPVGQPDPATWADYNHERPRVLRGGTIYGLADGLRAAYRLYGPEKSTNVDVGFRCARTLCP